MDETLRVTLDDTLSATLAKLDKAALRRRAPRVRGRSRRDAPAVREPARDGAAADA